MPQTAIRIGQMPAQPGMPIVVPSGAVKCAISGWTPTLPVSCDVVTGSVPALLCVVNAVSCAGKILRKNGTTGTSANTFRITALTPYACRKHATQTSASSPTSDQKLLPRSVLVPTMWAVSATIAYGVSRMT